MSAVGNLNALTSTRSMFGKFTVVEVTGETVTLVDGDVLAAETGEGALIPNVICLDSYTDRAAGDSVLVLFLSAASWLVMGSVPSPS